MCVLYVCILYVFRFFPLLFMFSLCVVLLFSPYLLLCCSLNHNQHVRDHCHFALVRYLPLPSFFSIHDIEKIEERRTKNTRMPFLVKSFFRVLLSHTHTHTVLSLSDLRLRVRVCRIRYSTGFFSFSFVISDCNY